MGVEICKSNIFREDHAFTALCKRNHLDHKKMTGTPGQTRPLCKVKEKEENIQTEEEKEKEENIRRRKIF